MIEHSGITEVERINLYKLIVAMSDIGEALITTKLFIKTVNDMSNELFLPLQDAIVILYARPFTRNKPYKELDSVWSKFGIKDYEDLHNKIIEHRHKVVAHSDFEKRKVYIVPPRTSRLKNIPQSAEINFQISTTKLPLEVFPKIEQLCFDLGGRLEDASRKELDRLYGNINLPEHPFDLI